MWHRRYRRRMRRFLIVALVSCSAAPPRERVLPATGVMAKPMRASVPAPSAFPRPPIDVHALLTAARESAGMIVPGPAQLVVGGTSLQPLDDTPLEVDLIEERGSEVRLGLRLPHARFAFWTARSHMLGVLTRDEAVQSGPRLDVPTANRRVAAILKKGTRVLRIGRRDGWTQIQYGEQVQVEGWVTDDAVGDVGLTRSVRRMVGRTRLNLSAGTAIRVAPQWNARVLARSRYHIVAESIEALADGWYEVFYQDSDVRVRGYLSLRAPPLPYSQRKRPEPQVPLATNATVPADTCLFAGGEQVGWIVGDRAVLLERGSSVGWFTLTIDTPWGAVSFDARGPTESDLVRCGQS
jgi:hypothetical protein